MPERTWRYKIAEQKEIPLWSLFFRPRKLHLNWIWYTVITAEVMRLLLISAVWEYCWRPLLLMRRRRNILFLLLYDFRRSNIRHGNTSFGCYYIFSLFHKLKWDRSNVTGLMLCGKYNSAYSFRSSGVWKFHIGNVWNKMRKEWGYGYNFGEYINYVCDNPGIVDCRYYFLLLCQNLKVYKSLLID